MKTPETETVFAGVNDCIGSDLPAWDEQQHGADDVTTFVEAIHAQSRVIASAVAYGCVRRIATSSGLGLAKLQTKRSPR